MSAVAATLIRNGRVVTASDDYVADVLMEGGIVRTIGRDLTVGADVTVVDASGLLVLPGGVDTHCHIEQLQEGGGADEESWISGSTACLAGGTTSVVSFSTQFNSHCPDGQCADNSALRQWAEAPRLVDPAQVATRNISRLGVGAAGE